MKDSLTRKDFYVGLIMHSLLLKDYKGDSISKAIELANKIIEKINETDSKITSIQDDKLPKT